MNFSVAVLLIFLHASRAYISVPITKVCSRDEDLSSHTDLNQIVLTLEGKGSHSAAKLLAKMSDPPCTLIIEVPKETHVIAVSLQNLPEGIICPLSLWFVESTDQEMTWRLGLCENNQLFAIYPEVYPHRVTLRWYPEFNFREKETNGSRANKVSAEQEVEIVVTAVGRGSVCNDGESLLCWKSMGEKLCISEELACDGYLNCPRPSNEEALCQQASSDDLLKATPSRAWDMMTSHIQRIMAVRAGDKQRASSAVNWSVRRKTGLRKTSSTAAEDEADGSSQGSGEDSLKLGVSSRLGTWTLLLLVLFACGLLLLMCGLWECFCRSHPPAASLFPRASIATNSGLHTTTTVFIISSSTSPPPQYDDLEQPPEYTELFPGKTRSTAV